VRLIAHCALMTARRGETEATIASQHVQSTLSLGSTPGLQVP